MCAQCGISLIEVPHWWDGSIESLQATIHSIRPDVLPSSHAPPIPSQPTRRSIRKLSKTKKSKSESVD
jgi:hypothetical protein